MSDPNNNRVQVFSDPLAVPQGTDPALVASLCGFGGGCTVDTPLLYPFGLAIDANGRLLVADASNNRIALFSSVADGLQPVNASIGVATTGLVNGPLGCDTADSSNVCLPDFNPAGLTLPTDSYLADLQGPTNIELDHMGHLLVADSSNMRVQRFAQPSMTLTTGVSGTSFVTGQPITLTVVAATTEPTGLTNVTPTAAPLAFSGGSCGSASSTGLVTTTSPTTYKVGSGATTVTPPVVNLVAGSPITFTMTFVAASASGPVVFSVGAGGQLASGAATSQQRNLDSIAINDAGLPPSTTFTSTPATPTGTPIATAGDIGWFIGVSPAPVIHLTGTNATEIDWSIADQDPAHTEPSSYQVQCGATRDVDITREGQTALWYRSVSGSGQTEAWHKLTVHRSFGPTLSLSLSPAANANNWYNGTVTVAWSAFDVIAGLKRVDWNGGGVSGSSTTLGDSTFPVSVEGGALSGSVTATSNSGATNIGSIPFRIDRTAPVVSGTHPINVMGTSTPAVASGGWYRTPVDVIFSATDTLSGFTSGGGHSASQTVSVTGEGNNLSAPVSFTDQAGNSASLTVSGLKIDTTPPSVAVSTGAVTPTPTGWFNIATGKPTVVFTPTDPGAQPSGLAPGTVAQSVAVTADTLGTTLTSNTFSDVAGNTAKTTYSYKMDTVAPTVTVPVLVGPAGILANARGYFDLTGRADGVAVSVTAADAAPSSGVQGVCYDLAGGTTCTPAAAGSGAGTFTLTVLSTVTNARLWSLDGAGNPSAARIFTVNITRNAPVANGLTFTTPVNTAYTGAVTSTGGTGVVGYTVVSAPIAGGTLTLSANGTFGYAPKSGYSGPDSFVFKATDAVTGAGTTATVNVLVGNGTAPPVATADAASTPTGTAAVIDVLANDFDPDGDTLAIKSVASPTAKGGTAVISGGRVSYTPPSNLARGSTDTFSYTVVDGKGATAAAMVTVTIVNKAPVATADAVSLFKGDSVTFSVLANDVDADHDTLKVTATTSPAHGAISVGPSGTITYQAKSGYAGTDGFTYTVNDGHGGTAIGTVTITTKQHYDGDGCSHDRSRGWHDDDSCDHDRDTDRRHDNRWGR